MKTGRIARGLALAVALTAGAAQAQERVTLGWGRMFTNDGMGDGHDRWRTGAYTVSRLRGPSWSGSLPATFGEILEFRARAEIISPSTLSNPPPGDRRYAGVLTLGMHSHFASGGVETSLGLDLAVTGPQTGLGRLQDRLHDLLGVAQPQVLADQIGDAVYPTLVFEAGRSLPLADAVTLRPFVAAQAGGETWARLGADLTLGRFGQNALMLREATTGQRYRAISGDHVPGLTFTLGGDIAHVWDSALLPEGGAAEMKDTRERLRAGLAWQGAGGLSAFYGLTWLSEEFETHGEGQLLGALTINLRF